MLYALLFCMIDGLDMLPWVNHVGTMEINTVVEATGRERLTQIIYRDHRGVIRDWRMLNNKDMLPVYGLAIWQDADKVIAVITRWVRRTVTTNDPEADDRRTNPNRRKLVRE